MEWIMGFMLVLQFVALCCSLTLGQPRMVLVNRNRDKMSRNFYKPVEICVKRTIGLTGLKLPICKTILHFSMNKPPIIRCRVGDVDKETADKMKEAYGEIFPQVSHSPSRDQPLIPEHDGDMCCPTTRESHRAPTWMANAYGVYRDILQVPQFDMYQYYPSGSCLNSSQLIHCQGTCVQEMSTVFLMVLREDTPLGSSFEPFTVPSYCSCKNLGNDGRRASITPQKSNQSPQTATPTARFETASTRIPDSPITRSKPAQILIPGDPIRVRYGQVMHKSRFTKPTRPPQPKFPAPRSPIQLTTAVNTTPKPTVENTPETTDPNIPHKEQDYAMLDSKNITLDSNEGVNNTSETNATLPFNVTVSLP